MIDTYRPSRDVDADIDRILLEEWDNAKELLTEEWNSVLGLVPRPLAEGQISLGPLNAAGDKSS
ncbi:hypothetical protein ACCT02_14745 [Rhizobium ruizarguesonis]